MNRDRAIGTTIVKPIIYGNKAILLSQKTPQGHTHKWTVYVRPFNVEPLGRFIRRIQFKLHSDYEDSTRNVDKEPFEVTETGWGEFTVQMRIYFMDSQEKQANCNHYIALHQPIIAYENNQPVVVKEEYDELVFINPTHKMYEVLSDRNFIRPHDPSLWYFDYQKLIPESNNNLKALADQAEKEVEELSEAIKTVGETIQRYRDELKQLQRDDRKALPRK